METMPYLSSPGEVTLVILEEGRIRCCGLESRIHWTLGRVAENNSPDIPLRSPIAGRKQGEFLFTDGNWYYCEKGSLNGTFHNGRKIERDLQGVFRPVLLKNGDVLRVDYSDLDTPDSRGVWMLYSTDQLKGRWLYTPLRDHYVTYIGRDPQKCHIVQPMPYISAQHAKIIFQNGRYYVSDCGSSSGTWLNGHLLQEPEALRDKDRISVCDCHFIFTGDGLIFNERKEPSVRSQMLSSVILKADIRTKKVPDVNGHGLKEIIRDVRLDIRSGRLTALLGGSGAGKSTVMNCLNGMDKQGVEGTVMFHGEDLYRNFGRLKYLIGSVPQENVLHDMLSVQQELSDAAVIRLPKDTSKKEIKAHVEETLRTLNLEGVKKQRIRKLSGGEKKRVNIGVELVADRELLCLDEPDAGLDPLSKKELFLMLRRLAHEKGKSVLVIIHDVSEIDLFDEIIMMVKADGVGRLAFFGTPADARKHFGVDDLSEAYSVIGKDPQKYIT